MKISPVKKGLWGLFAVIAAAALYLIAWPTGMDPVAWTPAPVKGEYPPNERLAAIQPLITDFGHGPEAIYADAGGEVYTGFADGRLVKLARDGSSYYELADTGGRPLGLSGTPAGDLLIADAYKGLLQLGRRGFAVLATEADGVPFKFVDDVDYAASTRKAYFSDASSRFGYAEQLQEFAEHGGHGRLLEYDFAAKKARTLLDGLHFANGIAVGPDDAYVLVTETAEYRVRRYWLKGERVGQSEIFIDGLPGFPDNITYNDAGLFWLALYAPRDPGLDALLSGSAFMRRLAGRLPRFLQPAPKRHAFVLGLDLDGKVVANLQDPAGRYAPITSVRQSGPWLYFGSLSYRGIGRLPLNAVLPGAAEPPADAATVARHGRTPPGREPARLDSGGTGADGEEEEEDD